MKYFYKNKKIEVLKLKDSSEELEQAQEDLRQHYEYMDIMLTQGTQVDNSINIVLKSPDQGTQETLLN